MTWVTYKKVFGGVRALMNGGGGDPTIEKSEKNPQVTGYSPNFELGIGTGATWASVCGFQVQWGRCNHWNTCVQCVLWYSEGENWNSGPFLVSTRALWEK